MFKQAVGLITMNCMGQGKKVPDYVLAMNKEIEKHERFDDPGNRYYYLHIDCINFRASILNSELSDLSAIIDKALEIDEMAKRMFENSGPNWNFDVVHTDYGTPGVFGNSYHIYPHNPAAQIWNWVRYNRIYVHDIIRNCLIAGIGMTPPVFTGPRYVQLLQESQEILYQMQYDILASIPQHLHDTPNTLTPHTSGSTFSSPTPSVDSFGTTEFPSPQTSSSSRFFWSNFRDQDFRVMHMNPGVSEDRLPVVRVSGGYASVWALYVAGSTPVATPESQQFVLRSMERIGNEFGINQAKVLGSALKLKAHLDATGKTEFKIVPDYLPTQGPHYEY